MPRSASHATHHRRPAEAYRLRVCGVTCRSRRAGVLTAAPRPRRASQASRLPRPSVAGVAGGSRPRRLLVHAPA